jgi:hypothetical protein
MTEQEAQAEAKRRYGPYGFAATAGPSCGVGTRTPERPLGDNAYRVRAGWGPTWEEAFAAYEQKYGTAGEVAP